MIKKVLKLFKELKDIRGFFYNTLEYKLKMHEAQIFHNNLHFQNGGGSIILATPFDCDVIVSLTSYGERVNYVHYTIESILRQSVRPSKIVLWLAENEFTDATVPECLKSLRLYGLEIRFCKDIRSFKKLVPTLKEYPKSTIITIDDDVIYWERTIETLVKRHLQAPDRILFLTGNKICFDENRVLRPYVDWWRNDLRTNNCDAYCVPTGIGGVLYPADSLDSRVVDESLFMQICPTADDLWFKTMSILKGTLCEMIVLDKPAMLLHFSIEETQTQTLNSLNVAGGKNDEYIMALFDKFDIWQKLNIKKRQ